VKPFCSLQHNLTSRSVFVISNQIILLVSLLKSGARNIGKLFYLTTSITVHSDMFTFWQAALNGQTWNTFFFSENLIVSCIDC